MPDMSGVDAISVIRAEYPAARIIVLTTYGGDVQVKRGPQSGSMDATGWNADWPQSGCRHRSGSAKTWICRKRHLSIDCGGVRQVIAVGRDGVDGIAR
jgi:CheY-like chemotaxis protein